MDRAIEDTQVMAGNGRSARKPAPTAYWVIALLSLLWNAGGAFDYTMTQLGNADYMSSFTPEQVAYFNAFPAWHDATWAIGTWGALAGSVLLLIRSRFAIVAFAASLFGIVATTLVTPFMGLPASLNTWGYWAFSGMICLIGVLLLRYAMRARRRGIIA